MITPALTDPRSAKTLPICPPGFAASIDQRFLSGTVGEYNAVTGATINASLISGIEGGFGVPTFIAISPVPEPGSWALLAGGLALLGGMQHFRRARNTTD